MKIKKFLMALSLIAILSAIAPQPHLVPEATENFDSISCSSVASKLILNQAEAASEKLMNARMEYVCALVSMASYDSQLNHVVKNELANRGWEFKEYTNSNRRANTKFVFATKPDEETGHVLTIVSIPGTEKTKDIEVDLRVGQVPFGGTTPEEFQKYADMNTEESIAVFSKKNDSAIDNTTNNITSNKATNFNLNSDSYSSDRPSPTSIPNSTNGNSSDSSSETGVIASTKKSATNSDANDSNEANATKGFEKNPEKVKIPTVHRGFNDYTQTAFFTKNERGITGLDYLLGGVYANEKLYLTGHSLGGAVATLLGARLMSMPQLDTSENKLQIISFGAPAVGNNTFAEEWNNKLPLQRVVISKDPVKNALQAVTAGGYSQFGEKIQWQRNNTTPRFPHEMAVYLDAALRNYYDILLAEPSSLNADHLTEADRQSIWNNGNAYEFGSDNAKKKVYIPAISIKLHDNIQSDKRYMQAVTADMLVHQLPGAVLALEEVSDLKDTCEAAKNAGCQYVIFENITGTLPKDKKATYELTVEESIYDSSGMLLGTQVNSTTTTGITPIEAVMYGIVRGNEGRAQAIAKDAFSLGSILK